MSPVPSVSVVVPTFDRPEHLARCLTALGALDAPPGGFEVIIVDDGSPEPVPSGLPPVADGVRTEVVHQGNAGPAAARNAGAARARGRLIAFTDDDCVPDPGWLVGLVAAAASAPGAMLGGTTINGVAGDLYAEASQLLVDHVARTGGRGSPFFPSNNLLVPASDLRAIGGFDETFPHAAGEDRDLCERWAASGRTLVRVTDAVVDHQHAFTLRSFLRQHHGYGRGSRRLQAVRTGRRAGTGDRPLSTVVEVLRLPDAGTGATGLRMRALLGLSQVAVGVGVARGVWDERRRPPDRGPEG